MQPESEVESNEIAAASPIGTQVVGTGLAAGIAEDMAHGAPLFPPSQTTDSVEPRSSKFTKPNADGSVVQFARERPLVAVVIAVLTGILCGRLLAH